MTTLAAYKLYCFALIVIVILVLRAYVDCLFMAKRYKQLYLREPRICQEERMGWPFRLLNFLLTLKSSL